MPVALSACHRSHRSARVVSVTLKKSNTVWNNTNSHFYSKIKHKSAFISDDENIRCARLGCNDYTTGRSEAQQMPLLYAYKNLITWLGGGESSRAKVYTNPPGTRLDEPGFCKPSLGLRAGLCRPESGSLPEKNERPHLHIAPVHIALRGAAKDRPFLLLGGLRAVTLSLSRNARPSFHEKNIFLKPS